MKSALAILLLLAIAISPATSQDYTGTYAAPNPQGGQTVVALLQQGVQITGTMRGLDQTFTLNGQIEDGSVLGVVDMGQNGSLWFEAELDDSDLYLTLVAAGMDGQPDYQTATVLVFSRAGEGDYQSGERNVVVQQQGTAADVSSEQSQSAAKPTGIHDGSAKAIEWANYFANMKATQMESYSSGSAGGYSSRTDYHLCANGRFHMRDQNSVSVDTGGAYGYTGGSDAASGTWRIITQGELVGIELRYKNGQVSQHRLQYENSATYIDGNRWYITQTDQCGY